MDSQEKILLLTLILLRRRRKKENIDAAHLKLQFWMRDIFT